MKVGKARKRAEAAAAAPPSPDPKPGDKNYDSPLARVRRMQKLPGETDQEFFNRRYLEIFGDD